MAKEFVIPNECPLCKSEVDVTKYLKGRTIVRCIRKSCNWWIAGSVEE